MENIQEQKLAHLNINQSLWDQVFTIAPLVVVGTKEGDKYDLAPKHMVTPLGFGPYFGFVCSKSEMVLDVLPVVKALHMDVPVIEGAYLYLECRYPKILEGFDDYALITGEVVAAYADEEYALGSERDQQEQLYQNPLLVYVAPGRFAKISETYNFPFPKDFKR